MISTLRPECQEADIESIFIPQDTALFLIADSVERRAQLIHGRLHGPNGQHCALGCFWTDNPKASLSMSLVDEVATVNDSLGPNATPKERWQKVQGWLRWKLQVMAGQKRVKQH